MMEGLILVGIILIVLAIYVALCVRDNKREAERLRNRILTPVYPRTLHEDFATLRRENRQSTRPLQKRADESYVSQSYAPVPYVDYSALEHSSPAYDSPAPVHSPSYFDGGESGGGGASSGWDSGSSCDSGGSSDSGNSSCGGGTD